MIIKSRVEKCLEAQDLEAALSAVKGEGVCQISIQLARLEQYLESAAKACGGDEEKLANLISLVNEVRKVHDFEASAKSLAKIEKLALDIKNSTTELDEAKTAACEVLDGLKLFSLDYYAHAAAHSCTNDMGLKAPCKAKCPAHVDVPAYIGLAGESDFEGAVKMIRKDNPFPTACALVCVHPCEDNCRRGGVDEAINIRGIKKFAIDNSHADVTPTPKRKPSTGKKVAIIGAGPSGLTCAYYLALLGHDVDVYESREKLGGMLRYGIPKYRFPRERLDEDINAILGVGGISVETNYLVDENNFNEIRQSHDAVFVAIGAHTGKMLRIDNADAKGVSSAVDLLRAIGDDVYPNFAGKKVGIVGGGNVAMDCCRTSVRAGADEVYCFYRRRQEDMTANLEEIEGAIEEGVHVMTLQAPAGVEVDESGHVTGLRHQPQKLIEVPGSRPKPEPDTKKSEITTPLDIILVAVGQDIVSAPFEKVGLATEWKCFRTNSFLECEGAEGVWAGGDCHTGPQTAILSIGEGKVAAFNIDNYLGGANDFDPEVTPHEFWTQSMHSFVPRQNVQERPAEERKHDFDHIEIDVEPASGMKECGRCMHCDFYGYGSDWETPSDPAQPPVYA